MRVRARIRAPRRAGPALERLRVLVGALSVACAPVPLGPADGGSRAVHLSSGAAEGPEIELAADGSVWVGWVEDDRYLLTSSADGVTFAEPVQVPFDGAEARASLARRPRLAVGGDRVAVILSDGITVQARVLLAVADRGLASFQVHELDAVDTLATEVEGPAFDTLDQPTVAIAPDGELWASWKVALDENYAIVVARESEGWEPAWASGFPGQPCECCPHELAFDDGELLLAQRSNEANLREIDLGRLVDGEWEVDRVSKHGWVIAGCPFDGPRLAQDGGLVISWMDATPGTATAFVARSDDGGDTWTPAARPVAEDFEQAFPIVAASGDALWLSVEELFAATHVLRSDDRGETWAEVGAWERIGADLAAAGDRAALVSVDDDGLWYEPLD